MPFSEMFNPPLTTVEIPHKNLGEQAARVLLQEIDNPGRPKTESSPDANVAGPGFRYARPKKNHSNANQITYSNTGNLMR